jgi:hypothetical protein
MLASLKSITQFMWVCMALKTVKANLNDVLYIGRKGGGTVLKNILKKVFQW